MSDPGSDRRLGPCQTSSDPLLSCSKCFRSGDHLGALNAYSLALRLNNQNPALFSNRAAAHLKLRNLHKAVEDCSQVCGTHSGVPGRVHTSDFGQDVFIH